jgi:hypothetical protein
MLVPAVRPALRAVTENGRPHRRRGSAVPAVGGRGRPRRPTTAGSLRDQLRPQTPTAAAGGAHHAGAGRADVEPGMRVSATGRLRKWPPAFQLRAGELQPEARMRERPTCAGTT